MLWLVASHDSRGVRISSSNGINAVITEQGGLAVVQ